LFRSDDPRKLGLFQDVDSGDGAKELIRSSTRPEDFVTVARFPNRDKALSFANLYAYALRYKVKWLQKLLDLSIRCEVAINGKQAEMYTQHGTRLLVSDWFTDKNKEGGVIGRKNAASNPSS
jgi:hypothetical protein